MFDIYYRSIFSGRHHRPPLLPPRPQIRATPAWTSPARTTGSVFQPPRHYMYVSANPDSTATTVNCVCIFRDFLFRVLLFCAFLFRAFFISHIFYFAYFIFRVLFISCFSVFLLSSIFATSDLIDYRSYLREKWTKSERKIWYDILYV